MTGFLLAILGSQYRLDPQYLLEKGASSWKNVIFDNSQ